MEQLLCQERAYLDISMDFETLCHRAGIPREPMEERLLQELGVTGDGLIWTYRHNLA